jgi:hypothetical protein
MPLMQILFQLSCFDSTNVLQITIYYRQLIESHVTLACVDVRRRTKKFSTA